MVAKIPILKKFRPLLFGFDMVKRRPKISHLIVAKMTFRDNFLQNFVLGLQDSACLFFELLEFSQVPVNKMMHLVRFVLLEDKYQSQDLKVITFNDRRFSFAFSFFLRLDRKSVV